MNESPQPMSLGGRERDLFISRLITKGLIILIVVAIAALVQMLRFGVTQRHVLLVTAAILSMVVLFAYPIHIVRERGKRSRSFVGFITIFGGFIPYLFGCYLVFYEGFWRLRLLREGFSAAVVGVTLFYVLAGYIVVSAIYKVSEFGRAVDEGRLKVD